MRLWSDAFTFRALHISKVKQKILTFAQLNDKVMMD